MVVAENTYIHTSPDSYVPQNDNMIDDTDIEQMFPDLFTANDSELALNPEDFSSLLHTLNENSDFDKLAKDSVDADDEHSQSPSKEERWISQFLDKINPLLKKTANAERSKIYRRFCEYIFHKATFGGDSMVHICVKSDDSLLRERLCTVLHKFELFELLNVRNYNKETCLHLAATINKCNVIEELIKYGVDVNAVDADGNTALHTAIQENYNECVAAILHTNATEPNKHHIDLRILNDNGYTALHLASMKNNLKVVKMLDTKAAETKQPIFDDVEGKHGNNALHIAIESEAREVAEYLIQNKGVSPTKTNKSGHTAMYLARVAKSTELVNLMQRYTLIDDEQFMDDDEDDASSKDSFESQEMIRASEVWN